MFTRTSAGRRMVALICLAIPTAVANVSATAQTVSKLQPEFLRVLQPPTPTAALEAPLPAKLADRLGQVWFDTAQPACRESRSLDLASYQKLARVLLVAVGEHMKQLADSILDSAKADAEFVAQAGAGGTAELRRLTEDPVVKELLVQVNRRAAIEQTLHYLENIERALLLNRFQTKGLANPLATGDSVMQEIEKATSAALDYADLNRGKAVDRFLELVIIAQRAVVDASRQDELLQWGPGRLMPILEGPLKEHCIEKP